MSTFNNLGKPRGTQVLATLNGTKIDLVNDGNHAALVQVRANGGAYGNLRDVAAYRVDGGTPAVDTGFHLGDGDYRIFTKGELKAGVSLITSEASIVGQVIIQYYANV